MIVGEKSPKTLRGKRHRDPIWKADDSANPMLDSSQKGSVRVAGDDVPVTYSQLITLLMHLNPQNGPSLTRFVFGESKSSLFHKRVIGFG